MWRNEYWPVAWRTGATFVHDWLALGLLIVIVGHMVMAARDGEARTGMRDGDVDRRWAEREHPKWAARGRRRDAGSPGVRRERRWTR